MLVSEELVGCHHPPIHKTVSMHEDQLCPQRAHSQFLYKCVCTCVSIHTELSLDSEVTIEAVRNKNSSNTIVRSVARSYISVAERY